ncbi:LysR substrate-binding domain-containing protein [Paraburkholderia silvatlantica]|uniref:LysR family transcriptional regulator n=1 Tax=Paraburkholderia silvatlantica TaxID=321895 RepID=UPI0037517B7B
MDTLQSMRAFVRVVETGSFTAAAQQLETTTAFVSRAVSELETRLRTRLLNRTTRRLALTEAGDRYLVRSRQILDWVDEAEAEAGDAQIRPAGTLRVHSMTSFGQQYLIPLIPRYRDLYPDVAIEMTFAQHIPDLVEDGYDVSIVLARQLPDSEMISHCLGSIFSVACASPAYVEKYGTPETVADLAGHTCLRLVAPGFSADEWVFHGPNGQENYSLNASVFSINVAEAMALAVREGIGVGVLPGVSAVAGLREGWLLRLLPQYKVQEFRVYVRYSSRKFLDAKIRRWVDLLRDVLPRVLATDSSVLS